MSRLTLIPWRGDACEVIQCCACKFCYAWPFRAGDATFYALAYERTGYPSWKWEHQQTLDSIRCNVLPQHAGAPRLLEIGAGDGAFIRGIMPDVTPSQRIVCTEYSRYGMDRIRQSGVSCYDRDVRELYRDGIDEPFHVVCMFQVLEHQDQLDQLFQTLTHICADSAHLYISVPNQRFIEFIETNDALLDMPPNHIGRWNADCFAILGRRHGWEVAAHQVEQDESFLSRAKKYAVYRYMRQSQYRRTLASSALRLQNRYLKKLLQSVLVAWYSLSKIPAFYRLRSAEYASSQWVHLVRGNAA